MDTMPTGEEAEAEEVMRADLESRCELYGAEHPDALVALSRLGRLLGGREDSASLTEAETLMRTDLDASRAAHGDEHVDTLAALANLAQLLYKRRSFAQALPLARESVVVSARLLGSDHEHTRLMRSLCSSSEHMAEQEQQELVEASVRADALAD